MKCTIELPCRVGEKAYYVDKTGIEEVVVESFIFSIKLYVNVTFEVCGERFGKTLTPYKTVFFTREDAEKVYKELKDKK